MALAKINSVTGRAVHVPGSDIDTDRIIPARFMKCITFDGLGDFLFHDARKNDDGSDKPHPLNEARFQGASILLSGVNFGCGSSREHAPQALYRWGIRAVIAESFAEIFFGNCTTLGIPCVAATTADIARLAKAINEKPETEVRVDVEYGKVSWGNDSFPLSIPSTAQGALVSGHWDMIGELLENSALVDQRIKALGFA